MPESWHLPDITFDDRKRDDSDCMDPERGTALLRRVEERMTYTRQHVSTVLAWNYGLRRGAIAAIDLSHVHLDPEQADCDIDSVPHIHMRDRLKSASDSSRLSTGTVSEPFRSSRDVTIPT